MDAVKTWRSKVVFAGILLTWAVCAIGGGGSALNFELSQFDDFLRPSWRIAEALLMLFAAPLLSAAFFVRGLRSDRLGAPWGVQMSLGLILLVAPGIWAEARLPKKKQKPPEGLCQKCGYNLTGNVSGMCPECGTKIKA
jgi:hypothetical protein